MDSIIVDVIAGLVLVATTCTMAYLGVHVTLHPVAPENHKERGRRKAQFIACALVIAAVTVLQIYRTDKTQQRLSEQIDELRKNPPRVEVTTPPITVNPPAINFPTPPAQWAYVHPVIEQSGVSTYALNSRITLNDVCGNTGAVLAMQVECKSGIEIVDTKPIGLEREPMVPPVEQKRAVKKVMKELSKYHRANRTLVSRESTFETDYGPVLDDPLDAAIREGAKTILWAGEYRWKDEAGDHLVEHCAWLQSGWPKNKQQVWHLCESHNGLVK